MSTKSFTITEILEDRKRVHDAASTEVKKQMCAKYGIQSNKTKEIESQILAIGLELHRQRSEYTVQEDIRVFDLFWNRPESAQKIRQAFAEERESFIRFYLDRLQKQYELNPSRGRWILKPMQYIRQLLNERMTDNTERDALVLALDVQVKPFHDSYIKHHLEFAEWKFDNMFQKYSEIRSYHDLLTKLHVNDTKHADNLWRRISTFRILSHDYDKEFYMERSRRDFEAEYIRCVTMIAERILTAKMNKSVLKVQSVSSNDAKAFDIYVSDDQRKMHARSVWCAEYSDFVSAHWRFIITNA